MGDKNFEEKEDESNDEKQKEMDEYKKIHFRMYKNELPNIEDLVLVSKNHIKII